MSKIQQAKTENKVRNLETQSDSPTEWPAEVEGVLKNVDRLLQEGATDKALELLQRSKSNSPWLANATAVCHLRLGKPRLAIDIYRRILVSGGLSLKADAPMIFKINFATALLLNNSLTGYRSTIAEAQADDHPETLKLESDIQSWKSKMTGWQRLKLSLGLEPPPIQLSFQPGSLR